MGHVCRAISLALQALSLLSLLMLLLPLLKHSAKVLGKSLKSSCSP